MTRAHRVLALLAGVTTVAAVLLPTWRYNIRPQPLDVACGLVLLGAGLQLHGDPRRNRAGTLLLASSFFWSAPLLAVTGSTAVNRAVQATALVHVTVLMLAILTMAAPLPPRSGRAAACLAVVAGIAGAFGGYQLALPLAALALVLATRRASWPVRSAAWLVGSDLLLAAWVRAVADPAPEQRLFSLHALTSLGAALLLALTAWRDPDTTGIDLAEDSLRGLDRTLATALGVPRVRTAFPAESGLWLDATGRPTEPPTAATLLRDDDDEPAALMSGASHPVPPATRQVLALVRDHARLRRSITVQLDDLAASRRRLVLAGDAERRALGDQLRAGALARIESVAESLSSEPTLPEVCHRARATLRELEQLAQGLDPVSRGATLQQAVLDLARNCGAQVDVDLSAEPTQEDARRVAWFVCSEAVTNAVRHAPGSHVLISTASADGALVLCVVDDGPGGADRSGGGLSGLVDRAQALGARLTITSPTGQGTTVELVLPASSSPVVAVG